MAVLHSGRRRSAPNLDDLPPAKVITEAKGGTLPDRPRPSSLWTALLGSLSAALNEGDRDAEAEGLEAARPLAHAEDRRGVHRRAPAGAPEEQRDSRLRRARGPERRGAQRGDRQDLGAVGADPGTGARR